MSNLKQTSFVLFIFLTLFISCEEEKNQHRESSYQEILAENNELRNENELKNREIYRLVRSINEIHNTLNNIDETKQSIAENAKVFEGQQSQKSQMLNSISQLEDKLDHSRNTIDQLSNKLRASKRANIEYQKMITNLKEAITKRDTEIVTLKQDVKSLKKKVEEKEEEIDDLEETVVTKENDIEKLNKKIIKNRTVHYMVASEKELINKGIIEKVGGFLGIGDRIKLNKSTFQKPSQFFKTVDMNSAKSIYINNTDEIKILPERAEELYKIQDDRVHIEDNRFWDVSRFLIVIY